MDGYLVQLLVTIFNIKIYVSKINECVIIPLCCSHGHRPRNDSFNTEPTSHTDSPASSVDTAAGDNRETETQRKSE